MDTAHGGIEPNHDGITPRKYVRENKDFLSKVLARGGTEAQGYALAVIAEGGASRDIEDIKRTLDDLQAESGD